MGLGRLTAMVVSAVVVASACSPRTEERRGRPAQPDPLVYRGQLVDVLPRDAIPSIDDPRFIEPREADWLTDREPVLSVEIRGDARAYPLQILTRHEIVNDRVGGVPVAVTYCPLCNSAVVFERTLGGRVLEFGTSGKLYRSALVMYDRPTESLWTHFDGLAVRGPLTGRRLHVRASQLLSFADWRESYPHGWVLSRDTGHLVDYGVNPYESYDRQDAPYSQFFRQPVNHRLPAMARVVGVTVRDGDVAYPYRELSRPGGAGVIQHRSVVVLWRAGTASALDSSVIAQGRDVGATGVFETGGHRFRITDGAFVDRGTGSTWSITGEAVEGPMRGIRLVPIPHLDTFWFAWQAYRPDTQVYGVDA